MAPIRDLDEKSRRPSDSAFKQQRLPAWQPILTAGTVLPSFFIIGILFIPTGVVLLLISRHVEELIFDYTDCMDKNGVLCSDVTKDGLGECQCRIRFTIREPYFGEFFLFYGLSNFYQNHRRYVRSRDDTQLSGFLGIDPSRKCQPFAYADGKPILPCGAVANSLFNDSFTLYYQGKKVPLLKTGIAWDVDREIKFKNPPGDLKEACKGYIKPKNWKKELWELDPDNPENNGLQNEDFIVWMRTAALPTFRKLYRRVDHTKKGFKMGLPKGNYSIEINYCYNVKAFEGRKRVILSSTSALGGKNPFLGIAYVVVGVICFGLGLTFLVIHLKYGKSTSEIININQRISD